MTASRGDQILRLARQQGVLRARDLAAHGIAREHLRRLERRGLLARTARGLYVLPDAPVSATRQLAEAARRVPNGIICLLSALRIHDLTTQAPPEIWLAIDPKAHRPRVADLPLRIVRFSGPALREGIEIRTIDGVPVRVYNAAKTAADLFKYRNKIGLDVALEALRDLWGQRRVTIDELWRYAQVCRVTTVMRPYLEMLT
jgi:predicted transcriptional regulator of viral defense system